MLIDKNLIASLRGSDLLKTVYRIANEMDASVCFVGGGLRDTIVLGEIIEMDFAAKGCELEIA